MNHVIKQTKAPKAVIFALHTNGIAHIIQQAHFAHNNTDLTDKNSQSILCVAHTNKFDVDHSFDSQIHSVGFNNPKSCHKFIDAAENILKKDLEYFYTHKDKYKMKVLLDVDDYKIISDHIEKNNIKPNVIHFLENMVQSKPTDKCHEVQLTDRSTFVKLVHNLSDCGIKILSKSAVALPGACTNNEPQAYLSSKQHPQKYVLRLNQAAYKKLESFTETSPEKASSKNHLSH